MQVTCLAAETHSSLGQLTLNNALVNTSVTSLCWDQLTTFFPGFYL